MWRAILGRSTRAAMRVSVDRMRNPRWLALPFSFAIVACGSTVATTSDGGTSTADDAQAADASEASAPLPPLAPSPKKVTCGASTCDSPAFCCYSSVAPGGAADHCETVRASCQAPAIGCDETADCGGDELCCTGTAVLPRDAGTSGFQAATCTKKNAPGSCNPTPGVGNSSVQACQSGAECLNGEPCVVQRCFGRALATCGPNTGCQP